jgi:hypothetical protein
MPSRFNAAQLQILEEEYVFGRGMADRNGRVGKNHVIIAAIRCSQAGPEVSAMEVGKWANSPSLNFSSSVAPTNRLHRYYANRVAREEGRPRAVRKTPEQLERLRESWEDDPYPTVGETIILVHSTGLEPKQVKAWFDNERKKADKRGETMFTRNEPTDMNDAARMWRAYKKDPEGYVKALTSGEISPRTGQRQAVEEDNEDGDEWENR